MSKEFEKLDVIDDYLMRALASNKESGEAVSKLILSTLLQRNIGKLKVVAQRVLPGIANQFRGIRMDVEVQEIAEKEPDEVVNVYDAKPICHHYLEQGFVRGGLHGLYVPKSMPGSAKD